jgi:hypothetical protein
MAGAKLPNEVVRCRAPLHQSCAATGIYLDNTVAGQALPQLSYSIPFGILRFRYPKFRIFQLMASSYVSEGNTNATGIPSLNKRLFGLP